MEIKEKYNKINKVLDYIENILEVPRDEYSGMSACPFAKKERENDNLYIDVIDKDNGFFNLMDKFLKSGKDNAIFINEIDIDNTDTRRYQVFLNKELKKKSITTHKVLCINPKDKLSVEGFNIRSKSPYFLILVNNQKEINQAHNKLLKTNYFDKMDNNYKHYLGIK